MLFFVNFGLQRSLPRLRKNEKLEDTGNNRCWYSGKKVHKSAWGMPRLLEAMKDVVSCEKLRGFANET